jgi:hypothetical protein
MNKKTVRPSKKATDFLPVGNTVPPSPFNTLERTIARRTLFRRASFALIKSKVRAAKTREEKMHGKPVFIDFCDSQQNRSLQFEGGL